MTPVAKTAFLTSLVSYVVFALADYVRPGFVSFHFSVHWFLLACVVFGLWWSVSSVESVGSSQRFSSFVLKALLSLALFMVFWNEGGLFGDMRVFLSLVAAGLPWVVSSLSRSHEESTYE